MKENENKKSVVRVTEGTRKKPPMYCKTVRRTKRKSSKNL